MVREVGYLKPLNNQTSNHFNMLLETEKTKKEHLDHYGLLESMQAQDN
jgi:hypothetical protein